MAIARAPRSLPQNNRKCPVDHGVAAGHTEADAWAIRKRPVEDILRAMVA